MPSYTKELRRVWCKSCQDYKIHEWNDKSELTCECGKKYDGVKYSEVPQDKIKEQQQRYRQYRSNRFKNTFNTYLLGLTGSISMSMNKPSKEVKLIEDDAWLEEIQKALEEKRKQKIQEQNEELEKFKGILRNDQCLCGSGLKYKKCCLKKHVNYQ